MEVNAIASAAGLIGENREALGDRELLILSDSQAAIRALAKQRVTSKTVLNCINILNTLAIDCKITIRWVKAHVGIEGNERADMLAKKGAATPCLTPEPVLPLAYQGSRTAVRRWVSNCAAKLWRELHSCKQTKEFFPEGIDPKGKKSLLGLKRWELRNVLQIITGHGNLAQYRHKIGLAESPICPFCEIEPETSRHLVELCPVHANGRAQFLDGVATDLCATLRSYEWSRLAGFLGTTRRLESFDRRPRD